MEEVFDQWAEIYDSIFSYVREDIPFYVEEARQSEGPVLELGCGTGRVVIPIAEAGIDTVGLDFSSAMLRVAQSKARCMDEGAGVLSLVRADMRDFVLNQKFKLIVIPFRGFMSLMSVQDQVRTLVRISHHLAPGGRLIFNIFVPDLNMLVQEGEVPYHFRDVTVPDTGTRLVVWHQSRYDNYHQIINTRVITEELDEDGVVCKRFYRDFPLRYIHRWEMHHLLQICGFQLLDLYGDFDRTPFDETSTEMIWVTAAPQSGS